MSSLPSPPPFAVAVCVCFESAGVGGGVQGKEGGGGSVARVAENSAK